MKRYFVIAFVAILTLFSFDANAQMASAARVEPKMNIKGEIEGAGDVKITLTRLEDGKVFGTTMSKKGKFQMETGSTLPAPFKLTVGNKSLLLAIHNGKVTIKGNISNLNACEVTPNTVNREYKELLSELAKCKTDLERDNAMEEFVQYNKQSWISLYCVKELYKRHPNSTQKIRMLLGYIHHFDSMDEYKKIVAELNEKEKSN